MVLRVREGEPWTPSIAEVRPWSLGMNMAAAPRDGDALVLERACAEDLALVGVGFSLVGVRISGDGRSGAGYGDEGGREGKDFVVSRGMLITGR